MKDLYRLLRPYQWLKNVFVLLPLFFSGSLFNAARLYPSVSAFLAFCFCASAVYCFNDIIDADADRRHPQKRFRPIASGAVSRQKALLLLFFMLALSVGFAFLTGAAVVRVCMVLVFYLSLNLLYSVWLKQYAVIDVCIIAVGFVLRILCGGFACGVEVSKWLVLMTFLLTLFMALAKRRDDVLRMNETGTAPRKNTVRYNLTFINEALTVTSSVMLVCYIMYTVSPEVATRFKTDYLYLTTVFVLLGLLRYMQLTVVDKKGGDPTRLMLRDRFMQAVLVLWALSFGLVIYVL